MFGIDKWFRKYDLKKSLKKFKRDKKTICYTEAKSIGIIASVKTPEEYNSIHSFIESVKKDGKKVDCIVFIDKKEIESDYLIYEDINILKKGDLNWFGKPVGEQYNSFIQNRYDIIIELNMDELYAVEYCVALSNASIRAGGSFFKSGYADFIISQKEFDINFLFTELKRYLSILKA